MKFVSRCLVAAMLLAPVSLLQAQQGSQMLELLQQLTRLEDEVRQLRGDVEQLRHENRRLKNQQNDLYLDLDRRMRSIETGQPAQQPGTATLTPTQPAIPQTVLGGASGTSASPVAPQATAPAAAPVQPAAVPISPTTAVTPAVPVDPAEEQAAYKSAFNLLKVGKYDEAIVAYTEFLQKFPGGKYAANAQYWLGEARYVTRQFPEAIGEFRKVVSLYPQSKKLPDAMLKIGYIHYELKQLPEARQVLTDLISKHPGSTAARLAENRLQRMKLEGR